MMNLIAPPVLVSPSATLPTLRAQGFAVLDTTGVCTLSGCQLPPRGRVSGRPTGRQGRWDPGDSRRSSPCRLTVRPATVTRWWWHCVAAAFRVRVTRGLL